MNIKYSYILGVVAGCLVSQAAMAICIIPPCRDQYALIPVMGPQTILEKSSLLAEDAQVAVASQAQKMAKDKIKNAKSQVGNSLSSQKVPGITVEQPFATADSFTDDLTSELYPESKKSAVAVSDTESTSEKKAAPDAKIDDVMVAIEESKLTTNATAFGRQYEREKAAYMRQEMAVDGLAKVIKARENYDDLIDKLEDLGKISKKDDVNQAARSNLEALALYDQVLASYNQMLAARVQLKGAKALDKVGPLTRPVITGSETSGS